MFIVEAKQLRLLAPSEIQPGTLFHRSTPTSELAIGVDIDGTAGFMPLEGKDALSCFVFSKVTSTPGMLPAYRQIDLSIELRSPPVSQQNYNDRDDVFSLLTVDRDGLGIFVKFPKAGSTYDFRRLRISDWKLVPLNQTHADHRVIGSWALLGKPDRSSVYREIYSHTP